MFNRLCLSLLFVTGVLQFVCLGGLQANINMMDQQDHTFEFHVPMLTHLGEDHSFDFSFLADRSDLESVSIIYPLANYSWFNEVNRKLLHSLPISLNLKALYLKNFLPQPDEGSHFVDTQESIDRLFESLARFSSLQILEIQGRWGFHGNSMFRPYTLFSGYNGLNFDKLALLSQLEELYLPLVNIHPRIPYGSYPRQFVETIQNLSNLRVLDVSYNDGLNIEDFDGILALPKLEILNATGCQSAGGYTKNIHPQVRSLNLRGVHINAPGLAYTVPNLEVLFVTYFNGSIQDLVLFAELKEFYCNEVQFTETQLEQMELSVLSKLEILDFSRCSAKGVPFETFAPNLKKLILLDSNVTGGDVSHIANLENLEMLDLSGTKISAASIKKISLLSKLKSLHLNGTNIRDAAFTSLAGLQNLEILELQNINLSLSDLKQLAFLTQLKLLNISGLNNQNVDSTHIEALKEALPNCTIIYTAS